MFKRLGLITTGALIALALAHPVGGTIVIKKDLGRLCSEADRIVIATVVSQHANWQPGTKFIYTHTELVVETTLKGKPIASLRVSEPGGTIGDVTCRVVGMPKYAVGERVLLVLKRDALKLWRTHGLYQGKFQVALNRATDEEVIKGRPGLGYVTDAFFKADTRGASGSIALEDFVEKVDELARKKAGAKKGGK